MFAIGRPMEIPSSEFSILQQVDHHHGGVGLFADHAAGNGESHYQDVLRLIDVGANEAAVSER